MSIRRKYRWHWIAVRFVTLGPLYFVFRAGELAEQAGGWLGEKLPRAYVEIEETADGR